MISVESLNKHYGSLKALHDLSFSVPKGQVLGLLGQNGAGKTSLLNIMAGYAAPTSGLVRIHGIDLQSNPMDAKRQMGYLPDTPPLYPEMTVYEYLLFCCRIKLVAKKQHAEHIQEVAGLAGISDVLHRRIGNLSRGYRQRVGFAQALIGAPDVLLLDEPTAGFDPTQAVEFRRTLRSLAKEHAIVFSTHILAEVEAVCDRVLILHHGRMLLDQTLENLEQGRWLRFQLRVQADPKAILPALRGLPSVARVKQQHDDASNVTSALVVAYPDKRFERELFNLLSGLQAPILHLAPAGDTLEDIFVKLTSQADAEGVHA